MMSKMLCYVIELETAACVLDCGGLIRGVRPTLLSEATRLNYAHCRTVTVFVMRDDQESFEKLVECEMTCQYAACPCEEMK